VDTNGVVVETANSVESALDMLQAGRAELLWGGEDFQWLIRENNIHNVHFLPLMEKPLTVWFVDSQTGLKATFDQTAIGMGAVERQEDN
tara:strand:+ start:24844 stop:25110 length:267 start_codon:yes stop_codon:yes gene_type:complete